MSDLKSEKRIFTGLIIAMILVGAAFIGNRIAPFLLDNDNIYLKTVLSGEMTGTPEPHAYYIRFIFGGIAAGLYALTGNGIPWFGILMCLGMGSVIWYVSFEIARSCKRMLSRIIAIVLCFLIVIFFFYTYFTAIQYTIVSGMLGSGAVFAFAMTRTESGVRENRLRLIAMAVFSLLSYSVRSDGFLMLLPFFGMVFAAKATDLVDIKGIRKSGIRGEVKEKKREIGILFLCAFIPAVTLLVNMAVDKAAYSSEEWQSFDRYNEAHAEMVDYGGFPDYETYKNIYEKYGITETSYNALTGHYNLILDRNINEESFTGLAKVRTQISPGVKEILVNIFRRNLLEGTDRPLNILVYWGYLTVFVLAIVTGKIRAIKDLACIFTARMFDWCYLVYYGRYPYRVTQIIYLAELFLLIALFIGHRLWERKKEKITAKLRISPLFIVSIVFILFIVIRFGVPSTAKAVNTAKGFDWLSTSFVELESYLEEHPDNFYFFDMSNLHYRERALEFRSRPYENYLYMGSWITNSPWYNNKLKAEGIDDPAIALIERDDLYIIYQVTDGYTRDFLDEYFEEHFPGAKVEKTYELVTTNGFVYEFLQVSY